MGNDTNLENWAAQERLRAVERALWWRGWVGRSDLTGIYGISAAQASSDLQKYQQLNPAAMVYQPSRKRYESAEGMVAVMATPRLEEAMAAFLEGAGGLSRVAAVGDGGAQVAVVRVPRREVPAQVERRVFLAVVGGKKLRVKYASVRSSRSSWRWIAPHAFGHDGLRWHARAWCCENEGFRDFVLGRMREAEWPVAVEEELPLDQDWEAVEEHAYRINDALDDEQQAALVLDYGTGKDGVLKLSCRRAMRQYVEAMLRVPGDGGLPGHFVAAE